MAKKIKDKDLENVSGGGCLSDDYYAVIYCFNKKNERICDDITTVHCPNYDDAAKARDDKIQEIFNTNKNCASVSWNIYNGNNQRASGFRSR